MINFFGLKRIQSQIMLHMSFARDVRCAISLLPKMSLGNMKTTAYFIVFVEMFLIYSHISPYNEQYHFINMSIEP